MNCSTIVDEIQSLIQLKILVGGLDFLPMNAPWGHVSDNDFHNSKITKENHL